ncbi:MAG: lipoprotein-releasing system transmembrane subunit LolC [Candidatus Omnitrophica bacterium CG07_land_8_20_14_0_80_50_8]|nr:MAG: hypothetical protein AUJ71_03745 [Candidatus Omnitrophica bacterium CG1_02_49_16]PIU40502.1 MAG: lipoprotein-releasing system transmembrane subunit LolC [Candidatus Omnitrophica bacterium CG07_land_8_20_14_0_80_50_8]
MSYEWWIAKRYVWSKRRHPFVGVLSTVSVLGISVGVAALIVVLAVMNGFDQDLKNRIIGTHAHLVIEKEGSFDDYAGIVKRLGQFPDVKGASPFVEAQALVQKDEWATGVLVRGLDAKKEKTVSRFYEYLTEGGLADRPDSVVIGSELAKKFHVRIGHSLSVLSPDSRKPMHFRVDGFFTSGMYEYDANLIFLNLKTAQELFGLGKAVSGISVSLKDAQQAEREKRQIQASLKFPYYVYTWMDMNKTLFGALRLEKIVMFLILALIIFVACLNIAGSLTILVMDKTKDIGVLKSLGAAPVSLVRIFAIDGLLIGAVGSLAGAGIGVGLCAVLGHCSFVDLPKEIYYTNRLPVQMSAWDVMSILTLAVVLSFLSALYPAAMAGKLDPVKALRYE